MRVIALAGITDAKRVVLHLMLKPMLAAKASENNTGGDRKSEQYKSTCQNSDKAAQPEKLNTLAEIAKASGVSHDTVYRTKCSTVNATASTRHIDRIDGRHAINRDWNNETLTHPFRSRDRKGCRLSTGIGTMRR